MFGGFKERSHKTERIDRGEYSLAEFELWEKEMWVIHRFFGEVRALRKSILADVAGLQERKLSVLELAAGSGRLLRFVKDNVQSDELTCIGLEFSHESARSIEENDLTAVRADAKQLPFADNSFDLVFCTLFLHHLDEVNAAKLLAEMKRVARKKLYVIDLDRRAIPYYMYKFFGRIFLQTFTQQDGALSIKRAFRPRELRQIAKRSGLQNIEIVRSAINRLVLSAEV